MVENSSPSIQIDLNEFKLYLNFKNKTKLTFHFNTPSRRFYLSVIAFVVHEMKRLGKIKSISLQEHLNLLSLLNESIGGAAGSSERENLLHRIYTKWKDALPNLEDAPLFRILGRKKGDGEGGKAYSFHDLEKDAWANLFEYLGSNENVRLKFAIDRVGISLDQTSILFGDSRDGEAWDRFISGLKKDEKKQSPPLEDDRIKYPLPDEPSIAVLPFVNMSEDPKQEFLCDGMSEAIITALTRIPNLLVIARDSTFTYKGKAVKVKQVSEDLGVRYVLEGSIQRSANRVRITIQLIDALYGNHLWAERCDRELKDLFDLQDEITLRVLAAIRVKLTDGGQVGRPERFFKGSLDCYLKLVEAKGYGTRWNIEANNLARQMAQEAITMCPDNPWGYTTLGWTYWRDYLMENTKSPRETIEKGMELARKALSFSDYDSNAHALLCRFYSVQGDHDKALAEGKRAMDLNPGGISEIIAYASSLRLARSPEEAIPLYERAIRLNPFAPSYFHQNFGETLRMVGRFEEAVSAFEKAIQLTPDNHQAHNRLGLTYIQLGRPEEAILIFQKLIALNPAVPLFHRNLGDAVREAGRFDEAVSAYRKALHFAPDDLLSHVGLSITYVLMGQGKNARAQAAEVLRINTKFSVDSYAKILPYKDQSQNDKIVNALRKAGLK